MQHTLYPDETKDVTNSFLENGSSMIYNDEQAV